MFKPFSIFVGSRYTSLKRKNHFISFISLTSMLGLAVGVTALITVLSVMNGFRTEIRAQMLSVTPHISVKSFDNNMTAWPQLVTELRKFNEVTGAAPYVIGQGMLANSDKVAPVIVRGIDPGNIDNVYPLHDNIKSGDLHNLQERSYKIAMGKELAQYLGLKVNDKVILMVPSANLSPLGVTPRLKRLELAAIYNTGTYFDQKHIFISIEDAQKIYQMDNIVSGVELKVKNELQSPVLAEKYAKFFSYDYYFSDWTQEFKSFFEAMKMEKTVMSCILFLIVAVAAFNLIASLVMIVADKKRDIAILRTMGAKAKTIMAIFMIQGTLVGLVGTVLGLIFGLLLAFNVTNIVNWIQDILQVKFISEEHYLIGFVPSEVQSADVIIVVVGAIIMSFLATIYPAYKSSKILPAEALRYE